MKIWILFTLLGLHRESDLSLIRDILIRKKSIENSYIIQFYKYYRKYIWTKSSTTENTKIIYLLPIIKIWELIESFYCLLIIPSSERMLNSVVEGTRKSDFLCVLSSSGTISLWLLWLFITGCHVNFRLKTFVICFSSGTSWELAWLLFKVAWEKGYA